MPEYNDWNAAIGEWFFHPDAAGETVRLTVDAATLRQCMESHEGHHEFESDGQAKADFIEAIREELEARYYRWHWLTEPEFDCWPDFLGLIAVQVLAVYEMDDDPDGEYTKNAYWLPLAKMLEMEASGNLPYGFTYSDHQTIWRDGLAYWVNDLRKGQLGTIDLPEPRGGCHHIRLPFSQALLRTADLEQLHVFFRWWGFQPRTTVSKKEVLRVLRSSRDDAHLFSRHAQRVLQDDPDRLIPACEQVLRHLKQWDGRAQSLCRVVTRPKPREIELSLRVTRREPAALEVRLEDTVAKKSKSLSDSDIAELFRDGVVNRLSIEGLRFRPRHREFVLAVHDDTTNQHFSQANARRGDRVLLLLHWGRKREWLASLKQVAVPERIRQFHPTDVFISGSWSQLSRLPNDWCLIQLQIRPDLTDPPSPWDAVIDLDAIRLHPEGGLRLSRREWLAGAGPLIRVEGRNEPTHLFVDDAPFPVEDRILTSPLLDQPGVHIVSVNRSDGVRGPKKRIAVREAEITTQEKPFGGGWIRDDIGWPILEADIEDEQHDLSVVVGTAVYGPWPPLKTRTGSPEREALSLLLLKKTGVDVVRSVSVSDHPVVQALRSTNVTSITAQGRAANLPHGIGKYGSPKH